MAKQEEWYALYIREFLNKPTFNSSAHIIASIEKDEAYKWVDPKIRIADCNRIVELDFSICSESDRINSLHKLELLIETIEKFRSALHKVIPLYEAKQKELQEEEHAKKATEATEKSVASSLLFY